MPRQTRRPPIGQSAKESVAKAKEDALRLLRYRCRSERELLLRLQAKGFSEATAKSVIARLKKVGLIDDAAFAKAIVQSALDDTKPHARWEVRFKLQRLGIPDDLIDQALSLWTDEVERQMAERYLRRRLSLSANSVGRLPTAEEIARAFRAAKQKGFDLDALRDALRALHADPDG
jgi:regulatory protein